MTARSGRVPEITRIDIDAIEVGNRMRRLDEDHVAALASSIRAIGLQTPVTVVMAPGGDGFTLIAGRHRIEAVKQLRWGRIEAFITTADELDRQLWEIDENLIRADLTELERGQHLERRKKIFDARASEKTGGESLPTSLKDGRKAGPQHGKGFAQDTAEKTGLSKSSINKSLRRAEKITPEVQEDIKDTAIADKGVELDALADMSPAEQKRAVTEVKTGRAASVRAARETIALRPQKKKRRGRTQAQERSVYWRNLREAFEQINGMPDVEYIATTVPAPSCDMVTKILLIARNWLDNFQTEWTKKQVGDGSQAEVEIELETITRAWDRLSDAARREFAAKTKMPGARHAASRHRSLNSAAKLKE